MDGQSISKRWLQALQRARLNDLYPDSRSLERYFRVWSAGDPPPVHPASGAPPYTAWAQLRAATQAAGDGSLVALDAMTVALRYRRDDAQGFRVHLDKCALNGGWTRTSLELEQATEAATWVTAEQLTAAETPRLRALVYRLADLDAELTFAALAREPGIRVQRVTRGTVGPAFAGAEQAPPGLSSSWQQDAWVASFGLEQVDIELARDRDNDPLRPWFVQRLSAEARAQYDQARATRDYHVHRDRKWVATGEMLAPVKAYCRASETKNLVYPLERA